MSFSYAENCLTWGGQNINLVNTKVCEYLNKEYGYRGPYYLYNESIWRSRLDILTKQLPKQLFYYSVKSCSNIHLLKILREYPQFGLDVVSGGEIIRAKMAGFTGDKIVFAGVGKTRQEIILGLQNNIKSFHVESLSELRHIAAVAVSLNKTAPIALRLNPDIDVNTHHYIKTGQEENKFGISAGEISEAFEIISNSGNLELHGLQVHMGSQLKEPVYYQKAIQFLEQLIFEKKDLLKKPLQYISLGGGFGIDYEENPLQPNQNQNEFNIFQLGEMIKNHPSPLEIYFEPGRFISAVSGILLTKVQYIKEKKGFQIAITDSGMSDLIRPALYHATHQIVPINKNSSDKKINYDIVGPICESGDFFAKKIPLPLLKEEDYLAVLHCGAYGSVMASNYNSRPFIPEILLAADGSFSVIRKPQSISDMLSCEIEMD